MNFPIRAAYLCTRTQIWGKEEITKAAHLAQFTNAVGGRRQGARSQGRETDHLKHGSRLSKGTLCGSGLRKLQKEGAAGTGRYLAHPTPHGRAGLAAPRSREETAHSRTGGRGSGRRRQGGARSALHPGRDITVRPCARRGQRPSPPRPDAQRARARARAGAQDSKSAVCARAPGAEAVAAVGGPQVPKGGFPWGSLVPVTGSVSGLDSLGESGVRA